MVLTLKDLKFYIVEDRKRYRWSFKEFIKGFFFYTEKWRCVKLLFVLRCFEFFTNNASKNSFFYICFLITKRRYNKIQYKYDTYINPNSVGPGLYIPHLGGIIVNCKRMGNKCSVTKGVVIGNKKGQENRPEIGDNCWFTLGCKVIGNIKIGDNVIVAQNSVVIKNIENNTIVSGIPAKTIRTIENLEEVNI